VNNEDFRLAIERGDVAAARRMLGLDPALANRTIHWHLNRDNESDPLHYVADCVGRGWLTDGTDGELTELLLAHGAAIDGNAGRESPLIAAVSLGAERAAAVLIGADANIEATSIYDSRALHWAAWTGAAPSVALLIERGARLEIKDAEFAATPLFWAVHGYGPHGPKEKRDQVGAARRLIAAGAQVATTNKQGLSALELAMSCREQDMYELLRQHAA
jgi:ankyrin repeat protein